MLVRMVVIPAASETTYHIHMKEEILTGSECIYRTSHVCLETAKPHEVCLETAKPHEVIRKLCGTITKHQNKNKAKMPTNQFINNSPMLTTNHYPLIFIGYNLCDYTKYNIQRVTGPLSDCF